MQEKPMAAVFFASECLFLLTLLDFKRYIFLRTYTTGRGDNTASPENRPDVKSTGPQGGSR